MALSFYDPFFTSSRRYNPWRQLDQLMAFPVEGSGDDSTPHALMKMPNIDVSESDDAITVTADMPGIRKEDVNLELKNGVLSLSAHRSDKREEKGDRYHRVERYEGSFQRAIRVPDGIDPSSVTATMEDGVLRVTCPKPNKALPENPHRVAIQ